MEYDLVRLFEHPLKFRRFIPAAIAIFGGDKDEGEREIAVSWKCSSSDPSTDATLMLSWNVETLRPHVAEIDEELYIARNLDDDRAMRIEEASVVVAVAVMAHVEPETRFTFRSGTGTRHDYYLNDHEDEMIEIAGRWAGGLPGLFGQKREQSDLNAGLRKRWVSVTVIQKKPRNRTEGLHS